MAMDGGSGDKNFNFVFVIFCLFLSILSVNFFFSSFFHFTLLIFDKQFYIDAYRFPCFFYYIVYLRIFFDYCVGSNPQ